MSKKQIAPKARRSRRTSKASTARYGVRFLERYGRKLTNKEIRLVQGYRGIDKDGQAWILETVSRLVIAQVQAHQRLVVARKEARAAKRLGGAR